MTTARLTIPAGQRALEFTKEDTQRVVQAQSPLQKSHYGTNQADARPISRQIGYVTSRNKNSKHIPDSNELGNLHIFHPKLLKFSIHRSRMLRWRLNSLDPAKQIQSNTMTSPEATHNPRQHSIEMLLYIIYQHEVGQEIWDRHPCLSHDLVLQQSPQAVLINLLLPPAVSCPHRTLQELNHRHRLLGIRSAPSQGLARTLRGFRVLGQIQPPRIPEEHLGQDMVDVVLQL
jgi:hypothetical protein